MSQQKPKDNIWSKYGFFWMTALVFVLSLAGHWIFGWYAFVAEQTQQGQTPEVGTYVV